MTWMYQGRPLDEEKDIPKDAAGFVYIIRDRDTGRKYIGRKLLTKAGRRQVNGRVKKIRKESDWRDYWSSSPELLELIEQHGTDSGRFQREILLFASGKAPLNYLEERLLYSLGVLESDVFINSNVRSKMYERHIRDKVSTSDIDNVLYVIKKELLTE